MARTKTTTVTSTKVKSAKDIKTTKGKDINDKKKVIKPARKPNVAKAEKEALQKKIKNSKKAAAPAKEDEQPKERKPRRCHPGTVALRDIRKYQKSTAALIQKLPFNRLLRSIAADATTQPIRWTKKARDAAQQAAEDVIVRWFNDSNIIAVHAQRKGVESKDMRAARHLGKYF